jgi:hypothetical protein
MSARSVAVWTGITLLLWQQGTLLSAAEGACGTEPDLARFIGSYDNDALIHHPRVEGALRKLLGDQWSHFLNNLAVRGAVDLVSGDLSLAGNAVHGGGIEEAVLCVSLHRSQVTAAIFSNNEITVYAPQPDYTAQTLCIKDWITLVNSGHQDRLLQPDNVRMAPK